MVSYLSSQGFTPIKEKGDDVSFNSPFRQEGSPSFHVSKVTNKWADFGREMKRFDILDFVMEYESCTLPEAIDKLLGGDVLRPEHIPMKCDVTIKKIEVVDEQEDVTNSALIRYMEVQRKIPIEVVNRYCNQIGFQFSSRKYVTYFGIGMLNTAGGYSVRSTWFKGSTIPSGYTRIKKVEGSTQVSLFEGLTDWLSYVVLYGEPDHDCIVLHSLVYITMLIDELKEYKLVHAWLDNDNAADTKMELMQSEGIPLMDHRETYKGYNDINEFLTNNFDI